MNRKHCGLERSTNEESWLAICFTHLGFAPVKARKAFPSITLQMSIMNCLPNIAKCDWVVVYFKNTNCHFHNVVSLGVRMLFEVKETESR